MKIVTAMIVVSLVYGFARLLYGLIKELAEIAAEAWHSGETDH